MQHWQSLLRKYNCIVFNFCLTGKGLQFLKPFFTAFLTNLKTEKLLLKK